MSDGGDYTPNRLMDSFARLTEGEARFFHEHIAPRLCAVFAHLKDEKFIGHSFRSEFPECTAEIPGGKGFAESPLFKHWAKDHIEMREKRGHRLGHVNAENFLIKHLVTEHERHGDDMITQLAMERGQQINIQERNEQIRHQFLVSTAQKVADIQSEGFLVRVFTRADRKLEDIENELRKKDIKAYEVLKDPKKIVAENVAALEKINGGMPIPQYVPIQY